MVLPRPRNLNELRIEVRGFLGPPMLEFMKSKRLRLSRQSLNTDCYFGGIMKLLLAVFTTFIMVIEGGWHDPLRKEVLHRG